MRNEWEWNVNFNNMLNKFNADYDQAFNSGDAEGCARDFDDQLVLLPAGQPIERGSQAIQRLNEKRLADTPGVTHKTETVEFRKEGKLLYQIGIFTMSDGSAGKFLNLFENMDDGSWKVIVSSFSSDQ